MGPRIIGNLDQSPCRGPSWLWASAPLEALEALEASAAASAKTRASMDVAGGGTSIQLFDPNP